MDRPRGRLAGARRPLRFGVVCGAPDARGWSEMARRVEALGYSVLLCSDHLDLGGSHFSMLSAVPALAAAAGVTTTLRLGTSVFNHDLRHPAMLGREAVTLDVLSEGRMEIGLGAGHAQYEYAWAGLPFDPARRRIARLEEYAEIVRGLTTRPRRDGTSVTFIGEHFHISEMPIIPPPVQSRMPIMIGGTERRLLSMAARLADVVNVNLNGPVAGTAEAMDDRIDWIRAAAAGRDELPEISTIIGTLVVSGTRRQQVQDASPVALVGSIGSIAEDVLAWRERWGISYVIVTYPLLDAFAPVVARLAGR